MHYGRRCDVEHYVIFGVFSYIAAIADIVAIAAIAAIVVIIHPPVYRTWFQFYLQFFYVSDVQQLHAYEFNTSPP
jgi:hypothetical protein